MNSGMDNATGANIRLLVCASLALSCMQLSYWVTNSSIYLQIGEYEPWVRDVATVFGGILLIALVVVVNRWPHYINFTVFSVVAACALVAYVLCISAAFNTHSLVLYLVGTCSESIADAWMYSLVYVVLSQLDRRPMVIVVCGVFLAVTLFEGIAEWCGFVPSIWFHAIVLAVLFLSTQQFSRRPVALIRGSTPQLDLAITNPESFLPSNHLLFVAIFVFSFCYGLAAALLPDTEASANYLLVFLMLLVAMVITIRRSSRFFSNADGLFSFASLVVLAGMILLAPGWQASEGFVLASATFLLAGSVIFNLLMVVVVVSIASRNPLTVLSIAALTTGLYWLGIEVGSLLGNTIVATIDNFTLMQWLSFGLSLVFCAYAFLMLRHFSFEGVIDGIQKFEPVALAAPEEPMATGRADAAGSPTPGTTREDRHRQMNEGRLAALAAAHRLTPREIEVLELLAQGRTVKVIEERLFISKNTVRYHTKNIYSKLGVHSQQELIDKVESTDVIS